MTKLGLFSAAVSTSPPISLITQADHQAATVDLSLLCGSDSIPPEICQQMSGSRSLEFAFAVRPLNNTGHIALWEREIYHRDASAANIMYYCCDGRVIGVLNDWELTTMAPDSNTPGTCRTGTISFIALRWTRY